MGGSRERFIAKHFVYHLYPNIWRFVPLKKTPLTYMHEKAVLGTMFQTVFTPCLQISPSLIRTKNGHFTGGLGFYLHFVYSLDTQALTYMNF